MKVKNVYFGLLVFSVVMFVCALIMLAYQGLSNGRSLFVQLLPSLVFAACCFLFFFAYRKAVKKEAPFE
ncbi:MULTISPECIES: hypothetical protein [unclassified Flavobacterium]|uniref:hypothetical protein n=1 Tax=unclassified Flavobacterium TaxID=196869 RepID=UPI001F144857|nr:MULTISPECIES: hypothetical protein [unclassified Flavobacterium]UMY64608.1 hypothetical protein MKO97_08795 [Flavobacterium sp. HJ-32-4]